MTLDACQEAFDTYRNSCPQPRWENGNGKVMDTRDSPGCHMELQLDDFWGSSHSEWQFNSKSDTSGAYCCPEHHPICVVNGSHTDACQVFKNPEFCGQHPDLGTGLIIVVVVLVVVVLPCVGFWSCCSDTSKGTCPPRWGGFFEGGCCCQREKDVSHDNNTTQTEVGVVGTPIGSTASSE